MADGERDVGESGDEPAVGGGSEEGGSGGNRNEYAGVDEGGGAGLVFLGELRSAYRSGYTYDPAGAVIIPLLPDMREDELFRALPGLWAATLLTSPIYLNARTWRVKRRFVWRRIDEREAIVERLPDHQVFRVKEPAATMILILATKYEERTVKEIVADRLLPLIRRVNHHRSRRTAAGDVDSGSSSGAGGGGGGSGGWGHPPLPREAFDDPEKAGTILQTLYWLTAYLAEKRLIQLG